MKKFLFIFLINYSFLFPVDEKVREYWKKTMEYGVSGQRTGVIKSIEENKSQEDYYLIEKALVSDINPDVRGYAAYSLINLKIAKPDVWINALQNEKDTEVLRKIAYGISELKISNAGPVLYNQLTNRIENQKETLLVATIIRAIGEIGYKPSSQYLANILSNITYPNEIRSAAAIAIGSFNDEANIPLLQQILENPGEAKEVRMYAAYGIGRTGSQKAFDILSPYIENEKEDLNIRLWSISGLSFVKGEKSIQKLIDFSKVDNVRIRLEAIKSLGKYEKNDRIIEILKYKADFDPEFAVKKEAKKALQNMGIDLDKEKSTQDKKQEQTATSTTSSTNTTQKIPEKTTSTNKNQSK
ncbi:MAG: HEAT repeat domain-containing protein [Brevinematales bacterium]|nr:HEAT repeat domain-containing protein [Brevinematales bacterium]